ALRKVGQGTLVIHQSDLTHDIRLEAGTLGVGTAMALDPDDPGHTLRLEGGTLALFADAVLPKVDLAGMGTRRLALNGWTAEAQWPVAGGARLWVSGEGTLDLRNANQFDGGLTVMEG